MRGAKNLTEGPIVRQLFNLAMPIMGTSFIQMAYSITDMAWVGRLGSEAVAAVGAVGILTWMTNSISYLSKVGSEVSVAQSIGIRDEEKARLFASHNLTIALILSVIWGALLFLFAQPVIHLYKLEAPIEAQAVSYLRIVATAFPFIFLSAAFTGIHNASGLSKTPFYISGVGLLLNMVLDPLFIFGFNLGTNGAAWATWLSQAVVCLLFIYQLKIRNPLFGGFHFLTRLKSEYTLKIIHIGLPVATLNALFAVINFFMARTASTYGGHIGLMTLTAGGQIEAIAWNTSQGFSTALSSFVAQNYAAKEWERVKGAYRIVPEQAAYEAGGVYLRIDGYSMLFMMLEITNQGLFYGVGRTIPPAVVSITFNSLRIPTAILLCQVIGINGVWWAISLSSIAKGIVPEENFKVTKQASPVNNICLFLRLNWINSKL